MNTSTPFGTAKIYQFPRKAGALDGSRRPEPSLTETRLQRVLISDAGSWYHQAAVETDRLRKL